MYLLTSYKHNFPDNKKINLSRSLNLSHIKKTGRRFKRVKMLTVYSLFFSIVITTHLLALVGSRSAPPTRRNRGKPRLQYNEILPIVNRKIKSELTCIVSRDEPFAIHTKHNVLHFPRGPHRFAVPPGTVQDVSACIT